MAYLSLSFDGAVAILTLSAPLNNRFGVAVIDDLDNAIDELTAKEARAVLLCADGPDFSPSFRGPTLRAARSNPSSNGTWTGSIVSSVCPSLSSQRSRAFATAADSS
jgi:enoyl-CoA hydratase/carnithine racemase